MDAFVHQLAEGRVYGPLTLHAGHAREGRTFDRQAEMAFAGGVVTAVAAVLFAVVIELEAARGERRGQAAEDLGRDRPGGAKAHPAYIGGMATKASRWHGRVEGACESCAHAGCDQPGEYKAPLRPASFDGPGEWRFLCLEHVREHNARYNFFAGMSPDEIQDAQSPVAGWERASRPFAQLGSDPPPAWSDFADPLDAIGARFRSAVCRRAPSRFTPAEQRALSVLGLGEGADRGAVRRAYSSLVRRFHPDKNGGDRTHEKALRAVIDAYTALKSRPAFA